jgi:Spy/CpxP family protein refolding chaperone
MRFARVIAGCAMVAALALLSVSGVNSQDKKDKDTPKTKGHIPTGWGRLNLSPAQKQSIYTIGSDYQDKIKALQEEIRKLESERYKKMVGVLTAEQKKMLTDGLTDDNPPAKDKAKDSKDSKDSKDKQ